MIVSFGEIMPFLRNRNREARIRGVSDYFRCFCGQNEIRNVQFDVAKAQYIVHDNTAFAPSQSTNSCHQHFGHKAKKFIAKPFKVD